MQLLTRIIRQWWHPVDPCARCAKFAAMIDALLEHPDWLRDRPRATPTDAPATDTTDRLRRCGPSCERLDYAFKTVVRYQIACELHDRQAELERLRGPVARAVLEAQQLGRRSVH